MTYPRGKPLVLVCFGTRPELIKLAPVIRELRRWGYLDALLVSTAQHREMLDQMLASFDLSVDVDLDLMRPAQTLFELTTAAIESFAGVLAETRPDAIIVQGDTTTAMCATLAGFYENVPVGHVEAGLRTNCQRSPFPEEVNRRLISVMASWHWCPTDGSAENLRRENVVPTTVTGNTVIDSLLWELERQRARGFKPPHLPDKEAEKRIVVTMHRRETQGRAQRELCRMLGSLADDHPEIEIVFPVHLSPGVRASVFPELARHERVHLTDPVDYHEFVHLLGHADLIVTDSGGVQEEAPALGIPVLVMRDTTERPEGIDAGCALLCGTDPVSVRHEIEVLLNDPYAYERMRLAPNPYGDGRAAERIVANLTSELLGAEIRTMPARRFARIRESVRGSAPLGAAAPSPSETPSLSTRG
jgi:UDP-N-acetylglucosamine 2-epimerase (non-hydrolysing)